MAEMIVVNENPLENLQTLRGPAAVIMHDRIIRAPKVKKMREVEAELDKWL